MRCHRFIAKFRSAAEHKSRCRRSGMLAQIGVQFGNSSQLAPVLRVREPLEQRLGAIAHKDHVAVDGLDLLLELQAGEDVQRALQLVERAVRLEPDRAACARSPCSRLRRWSPSPRSRSGTVPAARCSAGGSGASLYRAARRSARSRPSGWCQGLLPRPAPSKGHSCRASPNPSALRRWYRRPPDPGRRRWY